VATRRWAGVGLLLALFVVTRAGGAWLANHPEKYRAGPITVSGDVDYYENWATGVIREGGTAYDDVKIEYPPGNLPFIFAPLAAPEGDTYRSWFIGLMLVVDALGLLGLVVLARRQGSWWGPWLWTFLVPLLGPISYCRLDMVPAVATIWALERAQAKGWFWAGALFGLGAVTKIYPAFLLVVALARRWRTRLALGAAAALVLAVLPFLGVLGGLWDSVVGYHTGRGLQVESTWSAGLLAASHFDRPALIVFEHGAFHTQSTGAGLLKTASSALSLGTVAAAAWLARRRVGENSFADLAVLLFGTLALLLALGSVFSPQFMLWLSALGAVVAAAAPRRLRVGLVLLAAANGLSQALFPFHYEGLLQHRVGPLVLLGVRNACVAAIGLLVFQALWRRGLTPAEPQSVTSSEPPVLQSPAAHS
jgi:hypothetical protein